MKFVLSELRLGPFKLFTNILGIKSRYRVLLAFSCSKSSKQRNMFKVEEASKKAKS